MAFLAMAFFVAEFPLSAQAAAPTTNMSADVVVGQENFTSNSVNRGNLLAPTANTIFLVPGVWSDGKKLIMSDIYNNRATIFNNFPTSSDASANIVIGQPDMNTLNANVAAAADNVRQPYNVFSDGVKMFVADTSHNRVLIYNTIPATSAASANVVVGQPDMTSSNSNQGGSPSANTLFSPEGVYSDGVRLFIADTLNSRILIYNSIPTANNASADIVIGQQNMASNSPNQGGSAGAGTLAMPTGVYVHSGKLFVADDVNNRVFIFNSIPTASGAQANVVIGQPDMTSNSANQGGTVAANTCKDPFSVMSDGTRLYVSERGNHRVTIFNSVPTANNASADVVIGQANFTSNFLNQGAGTGGANANTLYAQGDAYFAAGKLIVGDALNARVLIFSFDSASTWQSNKSKSFYGGIKGRLTKKSVTFSGKKTTAKKGRVYVYRNGVLKKTVKIKKSGGWKLSFAEKQRGVNALYQLRFYNSANQIVGISDPLNVYLASSARRRAVEKPAMIPMTAEAKSSNNNGSSGKNPGWPDLPIK